jgi:hypothetical protein
MTDAVIQLSGCWSGSANGELAWVPRQRHLSVVPGLAWAAAGAELEKLARKTVAAICGPEP